VQAQAGRSASGYASRALPLAMNSEPKATSTVNLKIRFKLPSQAHWQSEFKSTLAARRKIHCGRSVGCLHPKGAEGKVVKPSSGSESVPSESTRRPRLRLGRAQALLRRCNLIEVQGNKSQQLDHLLRDVSATQVERTETGVLFLRSLQCQ
jgi:hypothetical protein